VPLALRREPGQRIAQQNAPFAAPMVGTGTAIKHRRADTCIEAQQSAAAKAPRWTQPPDIHRSGHFAASTVCPSTHTLRRHVPTLSRNDAVPNKISMPRARLLRR
jgi:hypothetical protein